MDKNFSKNYLKDLNILKHFQMISPEIKPKMQIKKIFLDCLSLKENKKKEDKNKQIPKQKSFSLYKYPIQKNNSYLYSKLTNKIQMKKKKIIINCSEEKQKKKIQKNISNQKSFQINKLSNASTRKSSDESPVEMLTNSNFKKYSMDSGNPQHYLESFKINCISIKKKNNRIKYNFLKTNLEDKNISKSKNKEKGYYLRNKEYTDVIHNTSKSLQMNYFLNCNKAYNTTGKKKVFHNNIFKKKIEPLKLFNYDASSYSSSKDVDSEENKIKTEINVEKRETEFENEFEYIINKRELSDKFDQNHLSKKNEKHLNKKLYLKEYKQNENLNKIKKKPDKSCKHINTKYRLTQNQDEVSNKNIIISSFLTKAGINDDKEKINQDSYLIIENLFSLNFNIYGVFDGHGENGHLISKFISDFMNNYYNNKLNYYLNESDKQKLFTEKITDIFLENHINIIKNSSLLLDKELNTKIKYDISQSGSTSVLLFLIGDILICSNVGDSQCILFNCSLDDLWTFESLSKIHLSSDKEEQKRIIENGGEIHPYYDENGIFEGPDRIYAKNKIYPGLSMSRTIGDLESKKIGVISEPDIISKKIDNTSKFLVIGSDGLWDVVKPYDVIRIVRPFFNNGNIEGACQALMKRAAQQWKKNNEERDDITIIVVFIGTPNNYLIEGKNKKLNKIEEIEDDEFSSKKINMIKLDLNL